MPFTHVLRLVAQAAVRHAMRAPQAYVASNVAGLVALFEAAARHADPQPAVLWASSSSVYGLNTEAPSSEEHRMDRARAFACRPWMEPWGVGRRKGILDFFTGRAYMSRLLNGENVTEGG